MPPEQSTRDKIITCGCCGFTAPVRSYVEAYNQGWRVLPSQSVVDVPQQWTCPLCPIICLVSHTHEKAHQLWQQNGRPRVFTLETCAVDGVIDNPSELRRARRAYKNMRRLSKRSRR